MQSLRNMHASQLPDNLTHFQAFAYAQIPLDEAIT